jgi:hypothetical protein
MGAGGGSVPSLAEGNSLGNDGVTVAEGDSVDNLVTVAEGVSVGNLVTVAEGDTVGGGPNVAVGVERVGELGGVCPVVSEGINSCLVVVRLGVIVCDILAVGETIADDGVGVRDLLGLGVGAMV